jgi:hypothetical protein
LRALDLFVVAGRAVVVVSLTVDHGREHYGDSEGKEILDGVFEMILGVYGGS